MRLILEVLILSKQKAGLKFGPTYLLLFFQVSPLSILTNLKHGLCFNACFFIASGSSKASNIFTDMFSSFRVPFFFVCFPPLLFLLTFDLFFNSSHAGSPSTLRFHSGFVGELPCDQNATIPANSFDEARWEHTQSPLNPNSISLRLIFGNRNEPLPLLSWQRARFCLRGQRIAFVGDSITRYQYLNLVHFLAHGTWVSNHPELEREASWPSWAAFYSGSSARLVTTSTREACDCYRSDDHAEFARTKVVKIYENRFFQDLEYNFSIAYYQFFEGVPARGIEPRLLTLTNCRKNIGCSQGGCHPGNCSSPTWMASGLVELVRRIVGGFQPNTLVINSGLWIQTQKLELPDRIVELEAISNITRSAKIQNVMWKTTTPRADHGPVAAIAEYSIFFPWFLKQAWPWRVFDAFAITAPLAFGVQDGSIKISDVFWDAVHFVPDVYRGLNEAFLLDLLRGCELCTKSDSFL